jgi:hypothetical protein
MPILSDDQRLTTDQYPTLFRTLLQSALQIFQGEQHRLQDSGREVVPQLIQEFTNYAYNEEPFRSHLWSRETKPLKWWNQLSKDSNARLLAVCLSLFWTLSQLNTSISQYRKLPLKFSLSVHQRSVMSALPQDWVGSTQHAAHRSPPKTSSIQPSYMTIMSMASTTQADPHIPLGYIFPSPDHLPALHPLRLKLYTLHPP